jgi:lactate permease
LSSSTISGSPAQKASTPSRPEPKAPTSQPKPNYLASALVVVLCAIAAVVILKLPALSTPWSQNYNPTGNWISSTALAALPILVLLGTLVVFRIKAHFSALLGLLTALVVALFFFHMPMSLALKGAVYGAGYGLFPICWIIVPVIFMYQLTVQSGRFKMLQDSLMSVTEDSRLQLLLIAFCMSAFFEGASGFGTPVAVCAALLITFGFKPLQAAGLALLANTVPVAFGALGIPLIALQGVTGLNLMHLSTVTARILTPFCLIVPFWLIWAYVGFRKMLEVWPAILLAGVTFAVTSLLMATFNGPALVDIVASIFTLVVLIVFLRFWKPKTIIRADGKDVTGQAKVERDNTPGKIFQAWMPWLLLSVMAFVWGMPQFAKLVAGTTVKFPVYGLHQLVQRVPPVALTAAKEPAVFTFNWLGATGTSIMLAAILSGLLMGIGPMGVAKTFFKTLVTVRFTLVTISAMLALGFITRYCGLDCTLGLAFARTGHLYPFFGALVGWLGTFSTGSATSSSVLFGSLQKITAGQIGVSPTLMASANASGSVMAKMVAAQSIVVASTATQSYGKEGDILRFILPHSLALVCLVGLVVYLMAYVSPFVNLVVR